MPNRIFREELIDSRWDECSWLAQSLYVRLLLLVCDFGLYEAEPALLCGQAFPKRPHFRPSTVARLLKELADKGLISLYQADGKTHLQPSRWKNKPRAQKSRFPAPPASTADGNSPEGDQKGNKIGPPKDPLQYMEGSMPPETVTGTETGTVGVNAPTLEQALKYFRGRYEADPLVIAAHTSRQACRSEKAPDRVGGKRSLAAL